MFIRVVGIAASATALMACGTNVPDKPPITATEEVAVLARVAVLIEGHRTTARTLFGARKRITQANIQGPEHPYLSQMIKSVSYCVGIKYESAPFPGSDRFYATVSTGLTGGMAGKQTITVQKNPVGYHCSGALRPFPELVELRNRAMIAEEKDKNAPQPVPPAPEPTKKPEEPEGYEILN